MNVYDFDGTIYKEDSTVGFYFYLIKKRPKVLLYFPQFFIAFIKYKNKKIDKTRMKEKFYRHLNCLKEGEVDTLVIDFWNKNRNKIYEWYRKQKKATDVIISASPRYILEPICRELGVHLICSEVNKTNGDYYGKNCFGQEKVNRFYKEYPNAVIDNFYSDSKTDEPLAKCAKNAFIITKLGNIINWDFK